MDLGRKNSRHVAERVDVSLLHSLVGTVHGKLNTTLQVARLVNSGNWMLNGGHELSTVALFGGQLFRVN